MDSITSKSEQDALKQEEIRQQIARLQAQLVELPSNTDLPPSKKQKTEDAIIIAPATPSPRKKRLAEERRKRQSSPTPTARKPQVTRPQPPLRTNCTSSSKLAASTEPSVTPKSAFVSQLRSLNPSKTVEPEPAVQRTDGFTEKPVVQAKTLVRDETLAIVEDLQLGPAEHRPLVDDPEFEKLEPNSGIRLSSRKLSHEALQEHLTGRYFLPPSLLYSVVRLLPNKQAYEVPVEGDWVTIAVVAERGDVRFTSGAGNMAKVKEDQDDDTTGTSKKASEKQPLGKGGNNASRKKGGDDEDEESTQKGGKKYVHLKLVDLGHRSRSSTSSTTRATLRGDAQLNLLLFESDYYDKLISKDDKGKEKMQKLWKGGSGGAFEECFSKLHPGAVVALLNPKVLKPYQNAKNPASSSILALTPPSASAIAIIGQARDLGRCTVRRRDGKPCGAWVDKRVSSSVAGSSKSTGEDVCEYHVQDTVQRTRAGRAEFSVGTSGMTSTARKRKAAEYDPARQWGLKPEGKGPSGEATYVLGGHIATSASRFQAPGLASETMGREGQARAKRRIDKNGDKALQKLLETNKNGGSAIAEGSREAIEMVRKAKEAMAKTKVEDTKGKRKSQRSDKTPEHDDNSQEIQIETPIQTDAQARKKSYSAEMLKKLGFDPTLKPYGQGGEKKKPATSLLHGQTHSIKLGAPPGKKVRSGVTAPTTALPKDESDSDLEIEP